MELRIGSKVWVIDPQSPWRGTLGVVLHTGFERDEWLVLFNNTHHRFMMREQLAAHLTGCIECDTLRDGSSGAGRRCATHEAHLDRQDRLEGREPVRFEDEDDAPPCPGPGYHAPGECGTCDDSHAHCDDEPCTECLRKSDLDAYDRAEDGAR